VSHRPQRYLKRELETSGSRGRDGPRRGGRKRKTDDFYRFTHQVGETRGKTRVFEQLNRLLQSGEVIGVHACRHPPRSLYNDLL